MLYRNSDFYIDHDFEIRVVREEKNDIDLLIPIENRTLNLYLEGEEVLNSRMQFSTIKGILFRFCTLENSHICTIHLLRNIDIHSSIVNFEIDYKDYFIGIKNKEYFIEMRFYKKEGTALQ
ncbi:hypothetical protein [Crassaminicella profunda]|uniref:hypothetical protein n=1 Tax=Crassaminicella profunda TaxID=1286698 RepID=UPI001CA70BE8|nr:hypothetical protein [Crassaminicella profunda]QZY56371.1 hypothetical protein K7H06_05450 [Crassaminicella profunda]